MQKKALRKLTAGNLRLFKIANRRGYGALCMNNLTEGTTPFQAYLRMQKAVRRKGYELPEMTVESVKKRLVSRI